MRNETADRISACSKLYGQQLEEKDIGQLQEMAKAIGIDDKDTMFLLLLVLQSHFKGLSINNLEKMLSFWYAFLQWRQAYEREIMGSV